MQRLFILLYTISGFAVLTFETIWIRALAIRLGSTVVSASLVLCVFFLFAALGNLLGGKLAARVRRPILCYGLAEIVFACTGWAAYAAREFVWAAVAPPAPAQDGIAALATGLLAAAGLTGLPSLLAGATFPLLSEALVRGASRRTDVGGLLYAGNLTGAALGVLAGGIALPMCCG